MLTFTINLYNYGYDRYFTICDSIERSLKKGGGPEKAAAGELATIICVQLGGEDASEEIYRMLKPVLFTTVCDNTVSASVRAKVGIFIQMDSFIFMIMCVLHVLLKFVWT